MAARKIVSVRLSEARQMHLYWLDKRGVASRTSRFALEGLEKVIGNKLVRNINSADIDRYFERRVTDGLQASTLNLHTNRLNQFFKWAERHAYIDPVEMPMDERTRIPVDPKKRKRVAQEDFARLLDAAPNPRDRIVIAVGLYTFLRASEIRTLTIGDIDLNGDEPTLVAIRWKTRSKKPEPAVLPICQELHDELANYFAWYSTSVGHALAKNWYLAPTNEYHKAVRSRDTGLLVPVPLERFTLRPESQMWPAGYAKIVQRALRQIGWDVEPYEGVHTLRRSGASELFDQLREEKNFDDALMVVMALLGHSRPETTLVYIGRNRNEDKARRRIAGKVMFKRAAEQAAASPVRILRAVE